LFLLDTDTCSYAIRGGSAALDQKLARSKPGTLVISAVTRADLMFGLAKRGKPRSLTRLVHGFLDVVATMAWDASAADCYADLRAQLERRGTPIGVLDTMIAAHALALGAILITNNQKHFNQVKALQCENWVR
jgi:tRNA(fMet)-specific endonuclease VapC